MKQNNPLKEELIINQNKPKEQQTTNNETMSFAGVGNAAAETVLEELSKNVLGIVPVRKKIFKN